jgi:hypothetical protein
MVRQKNARTASGWAWRGIPQPDAQPYRSRPANRQPARQDVRVTAEPFQQRRGAAPSRDGLPLADYPRRGDPGRRRLRRWARGNTVGYSAFQRAAPSHEGLVYMGELFACATTYPAPTHAQTGSARRTIRAGGASRWRSSKAIALHELKPRRRRSAAASVSVCSARWTARVRR